MATYACSDLHGRYDLYLQIKQFLKPEDKVYFLGDAGDRGPDSWVLIKKIYKDDQFIYMKGNHEDMLCNAIKEYSIHGYLGKDYRLLVNNGGEDTFDNWLAENESVRKSWYQALEKLPTYLTYTNAGGMKVYLSHAGFTPFFYPDGVMAPPEEDDLIWSRDHFVDGWYLEDNAIMVHGHTPIPYLTNRFGVEYKLGAFWYCNNHKICLDTGAYATNYTCLLDLDIFDEHIFQIEGV